MKGCQIYKTVDYYKIVTMYRQESWAYMSSKPVYMISIEASVEELSGKIFESLKNSRDIKESEEDDFWLGDEFLKELRESSLVSLYKNSTSCSVWLDKKRMFRKGELEIKPNKFLGKSKGLVSMDENAIKVKYEKEKEIDITKKIIDILS